MRFFAMPHREIDGDTEGFGLVFLEAAAFGKTSLAGLAGDTGSAVFHDRTGIRVDGSLLDEIIENLNVLLSDDELRAQLGRQAMNRACSEFSWESIAERTKYKVIN